MFGVGFFDLFGGEFELFLGLEECEFEVVAGIDEFDRRVVLGSVLPLQLERVYSRKLRWSITLDKTRLYTAGF